MSIEDIPLRYRSTDDGMALAHLTEELAEALTAAAKSQRFGPYSVNPELNPTDQETNFVWLRREMTDVLRSYLVYVNFLGGDALKEEVAGQLQRYL